MELPKKGEEDPIERIREICNYYGFSGKAPSALSKKLKIRFPIRPVS